MPASDRTEADTVAVPQLVAPGKFKVARYLNAPGTGGTWYYRACVDAVADESDTTNNCGEVYDLRVHADAPDFYVTAGATSGTASPGDTFSIEVVVWNFGSIPSDTATLRYYRSADDTINSDDTELATDEVRELRVQRPSAHSLELTAPETPGTCYVGACADAAQEVITTDNCSSAVTIIVQS